MQVPVSVLFFFLLAVKGLFIMHFLWPKINIRVVCLIEITPGGEMKGNSNNYRKINFGGGAGRGWAGLGWGYILNSLAPDHVGWEEAIIVSFPCRPSV